MSYTTQLPDLPTPVRSDESIESLLNPIPGRILFRIDDLEGTDGDGHFTELLATPGEMVA